jgi:hypothetical protein
MDYCYKYNKYKYKYFKLKGGNGDKEVIEEGNKRNYMIIKKLPKIMVVIGASNNDKSDLDRFGKEYNVFISKELSDINFKKDSPPYGLWMDINEPMYTLQFSIILKDKVDEIIFDWSVSKLIHTSVVALVPSLKKNGRMIIDQAFIARTSILDSEQYESYLKGSELYYPGTKTVTGNKFLTYGTVGTSNITDDIIIENNIKHILEFAKRTHVDLSVEKIKGRYPVPLYQNQKINDEFSDVNYLVIVRK